MSESVRIVDGYEYYPIEVEKDWKEKILPHLTRNSLIPAIFTEDETKESYVVYPRLKKNPIVNGTLFEKVLDDMPTLGRAVFIYIPPGMCLRHHWDPEDKYHLSVVENRGSFYFDYDKMAGFRMPADGKIRRINSGVSHHSAVNGGHEARIHLVMSPYQCRTTNPEKTFKRSAVIDFSDNTIEHLFEGKKSLKTSVEQNFLITIIRAGLESKNVFALSGENLDRTRKYDFEIIDEEWWEEFTQSDLVTTTKITLEEFGIKLTHD